MTPFAHDLAFSAVSSDAILVGELSTELGLRLYTPPVWEGHALPDTPWDHATLLADQSRLVVVLHQRLWNNDDATRGDAAALRQRIRERPGSVCVILLDETPVPSWLAKAKCFELAAGGLENAANFALDAVARCGGTIGIGPESDVADSHRRRPEGPAPFLEQPRAHSTLRHELDAIASTLRSHIEGRLAVNPGGAYALHAQPQRLIARLEDVGISFSWVAGRAPAVAEGRLLVIEWTGVETELTGVAALKSATPAREHSYRAEGGDPTHWQWRDDTPNGRAYSTANLLAEWLAFAAIATVAGQRSEQ